MRKGNKTQGELTGKYYVYTLAHPDGTVFYVGKGQRNRIDQHEIEARKGVSSHKCNTIRKIWSADCEVLKTKVAFFETDKEALEFEVYLIAFFGIDNLTNLTIGGEGPSKPPDELALRMDFTLPLSLAMRFRREVPNKKRSEVVAKLIEQYLDGLIEEHSDD